MYVFLCKGGGFYPVTYIINKPGQDCSVRVYRHILPLHICMCPQLQRVQLNFYKLLSSMVSLQLCPCYIYISFEAMPKIIKGLSLHKCAVIKLVCSDKMQLSIKLLSPIIKIVLLNYTVAMLLCSILSPHESGIHVKVVAGY